MNEQMHATRPRLNRREVLLAAAGTGTAIGLAFSLPRFAIAQSRPPLRSGVLDSFSKVFAFLGESSSNAYAILFDEINWEVAGRNIELIREDDDFSPQIGLDKARKLVESDKVDCILSLQASNVALAVVPYVTQTKTLTIVNGRLTAQSRARVLVEAIKIVDGDTSNKDALIKAVEGVTFTDPRGPFQFDTETHLQNVDVLKTSEDGGVSNKVVHTFTDIPDPGPKA